MRKQVQAEYWVCMIGPTNSKNLGSGCDTPLREAVQTAFEKTTGHSEDMCFSGWGYEKDRIEIATTILLLDADDPILKSIKEILEKEIDLETFDLLKIK